MNPYLLTFLVILGFVLLSVICAIFYSNGRNDMFQEQCEKLRQRQDLGEIIINKRDIIKVRARTVIPKMSNAEYLKRKDYILRNMAADIGENMLKDGLLELHISRYATEDSVMFGDPDHRVLELTGTALKY